MSDELSRDVPCSDPSCPTILGGPTHPDLCDDCAGAFEQQGIPASAEDRAREQAEAHGDEQQLTIDVLGEPPCSLVEGPVA